jgi:hypothetical protein
MYMLIIEGYFEGGQFIPDKPVVIPEKAKAVVTIEENEIVEREKNKKAWGEFLEAIENAKDEKLEGFPSRLKFKRPGEIGACARILLNSPALWCMINNRGIRHENTVWD